IGGLTVHTVAAADRAALPELRTIVLEAQADLLNRFGLRLCPEAELYVHPDLDSYIAETGAAWYQVATARPADCRIDAQRIRILQDHGGLAYNVRHELYHLAQEEGLERWKAEGAAE